MNPYKAPGLDGYLSIFFFNIECSNIIMSSTIEAIQSFFTIGFMLKELKYFYLVLIPKNSKTYEFVDYGPISLYNLIYKLISKIMANLMRNILKRIIAPSQVAFVLGCWIHKNGL